MDNFIFFKMLLLIYYLLLPATSLALDKEEKKCVISLLDTQAKLEANKVTYWAGRMMNEINIYHLNYCLNIWEQNSKKSMKSLLLSFSNFSDD